MCRIDWGSSNVSSCDTSSLSASAAQELLLRRYYRWWIWSTAIVVEQTMDKLTESVLIGLSSTLSSLFSRHNIIAGDNKIELTCQQLRRKQRWWVLLLQWLQEEWRRDIIYTVEQKSLSNVNTHSVKHLWEAAAAVLHLYCSVNEKFLCICPIGRWWCHVLRQQQWE